MTARGQTQTLVVTFYAYPGGPPTDATGVNLTMLVEGVLAYGPFTPEHDAVGRYRYEWLVPVDAPLDVYTAEWSGLLPDEDNPSLAYETFEVTAVPVTTDTWTSTTPYVCGWTTTACCDALLDADPDVAQRAVDTAAEILYALSARQFGLCELTVRPCRLTECGPCDLTGPRWTPVLLGGQWTNVSCSRHGDPCSCHKVCEVLLPGPIDSIVEVKVDGEVLLDTEYRVDGRRALVRLGSDDCWPTCQDMALDSDQPGTWEVTYLKGKPLPVAGQNALSTFACEIVKACNGDDTCALPKRLTSITRQGISMAVLDPMPFLQQGRTGLYLVDAWLAAVNPKARTRSAGILSPDMPQARRTTWPS